MARPHLHDDERRRRLLVRHHLAVSATSVEDAVRAAPVLHSSDPTTPHLSLRARVEGFATGDLDRALVEDRTLWRLHAMRRTIWVTTVEDGPLLEAAAGRKIARSEWRRVAAWLGQVVPEVQIEDWVAAARRDVVALLREHGELSTSAIQEHLPRLAQQIEVGSGRFVTRQPVASRLLYLFAMDLAIVRTRTAGSWRASQYAWAAPGDWFDPPPAVRPEGKVAVAAAQSELATRHLAAFGPATATDLQWWTGWTKADTTRAIAAVDAVEVDLDGGTTGLILPGDLDPTPEPGGPVVALLPALDHSVMGWKQRTWYLGGEDQQRRTRELYDRNGNVGPTVVVDGEVAGGWTVRPDGTAVAELLADVGAEARAEVDRHLAEVTTWLDGTTVTPRFSTPLEKRLRTA